jgi:adenosylhomocysteine nucleosidase
MPVSGKVAIVAAMEREIRLLVRHWTRTRHDYQGRSFTFFENDRAVAVCAGIGPEAARRACEAVIALYAPSEVISVGLAGALDLTLPVGRVFTPRTVIDAKDGSRADTGEGNGVLVSFSSVADPEQKSRLAKAYGAVAVDMEAAAVARGAEAHGLRFRAVKAISDAADFVLPPVERFVNHGGKFRSWAFAGFLALRPWLWTRVLRLARNSSRAAGNLCAVLDRYNDRPKEMSPELHVSPRGNT